MSLNASPGGPQWSGSAPPGGPWKITKIWSVIRWVPGGTRERQKPARVGPMAPKGAKMESQSSLFGAQKVTFSGKVAESGPLRKHQFFLWLKHIIEVPGHTVGHLESSLERCCCAGRLFSRLFCLPRRPGSAPVPKSEPQGAPKPPQGRPRIHPKSMKNRLWTPWGSSGCPGVPPGPKRSPKSRKNDQT